MSYSAEYRKQLNETVDALKQVSDDIISNANNNCKDPMEKEIVKSIGLSFAYISQVHRYIQNLMVDINIIFNTIEKLPKGVEFDQLKSHMDKMKKDHEEITLQIPQHIEKELKEWLAERERAKKAQGQYVT